MNKSKSILAGLLVLLGIGSASGAGVVPPYEQAFSDYSSLETMTVVNAEAGSPAWTRYSSYQVPVLYTPAAGYNGTDGFSANDWLITPALALEEGYVYKFSFVTVGTTGKTNTLEVKMGNGSDVAGLTTSVVGPIVLTAQEKQVHEASITVEETGDYCLGFHLTSEAGQGYVFLTDIKVEEGLLSDAPAAATNLSATAKAVDGKAVMEIAFTAPDKTNGGAATDITNVIVYRGDVKIAELGAKTPGAVVNMVDESPASGDNIYRIVCVNAAGNGASAEVIGNLTYATPLSPQNVVLAEVDGKQVITWSPVVMATSTSSLFIPSAVTYTVTRKSGAIVVQNITECTATDVYSREDEGQDLVSYTVTANHFGNTSSEVSNSLLIGNPYTGEYAESFDNYSYSTSTWQTLDRTASYSSWSIQTSTYYNPVISADQDGTNGFAAFRSSSSGSIERLVSPVINVSDMAHPRLSFYVYHTAATTSDDRVVPEVRVNGVYTPLGDGNGVTVKGDTEGWMKYNFDIPLELATNDFQLSFKGESFGGGYYVAIDNIEIKDALADNLAITSLVAPNKLGVGKEEKLVVTVFNKGFNVASDYTVALECNGETVATIDGSELASEKTTDFTFNFKATPYMAESKLTFVAKVNLPGDLNSGDDTMEISVDVDGSELPVPTELKGESGETSVALQWVAPVVPEVVEQPVKTEDFEAWEESSTVGIDGWTFVDVDQAESSGFPGYGSASYQQPLAFIVGAKSMSSYASTHSGEKMLVSPKNYSYYGKQRDDWAISPEVVGGQTITFYTCNFSSYGYVSYGTDFEFCYSTTDNNVESFTVLESVYDNSKDWTLHSFVLPDNARYFAIHIIDGKTNTSWSDALMIDDIKYQPGSKQLVHVGYNIYRDKKLLTEINDKSSAAYVDENVVDDTDYLYAVSAVYETGESLLSNEVTVNKLSAVEKISDGLAKIFGGKNHVRIVGLAGNAVGIYNSAGQLVKVIDSIADDVTISLPTGIYVVKSCEVVAKVVVR